MFMAAVAVAVTLAVGAYFFIQQRSRSPSAALVRASVEKLIGRPELKVTGVTFTVTPAEAGHAVVAYQANAAVTEALYEIPDTAALFREQLKLDPDAWQRTRKVLSGKTAPRIIELGGLKGLDMTLLQTTFLRETTAKGAQFSFNGSLRAVKGRDGWELTGENPQPTAGELRGKPRGAFAGPTLLIDDLAELNKLRALAVAQADLPEKVEDGRQAFVDERKAEQAHVVAELLERIKPGTIYAGKVTVGNLAPVKAFLEFTSVDPQSRHVSATLRNDGSWTDQRPLNGTFLFDADSETLAITLATPAQAAVPEAGPLLADEIAWSAVFQLNLGRLTGHDDQRDFALAQLTAAEAASAQTEVASAGAALLDASETGKVYRGTLRSREPSQAFDYLLRFTQQDRGRGTVTATLAPIGRDGWQRTYRGTILANRYRAGGVALRLETQGDDAVKGANSGSPAGQTRDSSVSLQLVNNRLQGEAADFSYSFEPLSEQEVAKLAAEAAAREKAVLAIVKKGVAYPGVAQSEGQSTGENIRLRFRRVDAHGGVDAVIEAPDHKGVARDFRGTLDTAARQLALSSSGKGGSSAGSRAGLKFPPLSRGDGQLIVLDVSEKGLSGELRGEGPGWKLDFPASGATEVTGGSSSDYPTETGAYVWSAGKWQPLPRNDGKASKSALKAIGGFFNSLGKSSSSPTTAEKVADLVFTGHEPVPTVEGGEVRLLYVGAMKAERLEKYPQLSDYPEMEVAATTRESNGNRKVVLTRIAADVPTGGFRERRVPATLERVSDTVLELSCTRRLTPGSYAISVYDQAFELKVE